MPTRNELQKTCDLYVTAYQTRDAHGCAAVFLPDAKMMSPYGPTACGREVIEAQHAEWTREGGEGKRLEIVEFGGSDDMAWVNLVLDPMRTVQFCRQLVPNSDPLRVAVLGICIPRTSSRRAYSCNTSSHAK